MGYIKAEWILVDFCEPFKNDKDESLKEIRKWIKDFDSDVRNHFYISGNRTNGHITIFMDWDGSKEGWDTSNQFQDIRELFIAKIRNLAPDSKIYYICDDEAEKAPYLRVL